VLADGPGVKIEFVPIRSEWCPLCAQMSAESMPYIRVPGLNSVHRVLPQKAG